MSPDPLAEKHLDWTPYNYVLANPLILIDPDGRQVRADLADFNPYSPYGTLKQGPDGRPQFNREKAQAEAAGALLGVSMVSGSFWFAGAAGTAFDAITGGLGLGSLLNWIPGGRAARGVDEGIDAARALSKIDDVADVFKHGDLFEQGFKVGDDVVEILAETSIKGKTLHLKDIAVYPKGTEKAQAGVEGVLAIRGQLIQLAKDAGFEQLRITGVRLSGAKKGKEVDFIIDLLREQ